MKLAHVVTLHSGDGAFGGPLTVAIEQCSQLAREGHDVTLFAGWDGHSRPPDLPFALVLKPVRQLVKSGGTSTLISVSLLAALWKQLCEFDAVHVHMGRDLISSVSAYIATLRRPTVLQTHGMIMPDHRRRARLVDRVIVRRVLGKAASIFVLTRDERAGLLEVGAPESAIAMLGNGVACPSSITSERKPNPHPVVLFCARLHPRKRVSAFLRMAQILDETGIHATYYVVGPDEGDLPIVMRQIEAARIERLEYLGAMNGAQSRAAILAADVFVLPSVREPFPMTILEALSLGTPCVMTSSCGISQAMQSFGSASVTDGTPEQLAAMVAELVSDEQLWRKRSAAGKYAIKAEFSIEAVTKSLTTAYRNVTAPAIGPG